MGKQAVKCLYKDIDVTTILLVMLLRWVPSWASIHSSGDLPILILTIYGFHDHIWRSHDICLLHLQPCVVVCSFTKMNNNNIEHKQRVGHPNKHKKDDIGVSVKDQGSITQLYQIISNLHN